MQFFAMIRAVSNEPGYKVQRLRPRKSGELHQQISMLLVLCPHCKRRTNCGRSDVFRRSAKFVEDSTFYSNLIISGRDYIF